MAGFRVCTSSMEPKPLSCSPAITLWLVLAGDRQQRLHVSRRVAAADRKRTLCGPGGPAAQSRRGADLTLQ